MNICQTRSCCGVGELSGFFGYKSSTFINLLLKHFMYSNFISQIVAFCPNETKGWKDTVAEMQKDGWVILATGVRPSWHGSGPLVTLYYDCHHLKDTWKDMANSLGIREEAREWF